jgi:hypothetical protein
VLVAVPVGYETSVVVVVVAFELLAVPASTWQLDTDIALEVVVEFVRIARVAAFAASAFSFRGMEAFADWMVGMGLQAASETTC